jgi:hypothetical protein
MGNNDNSVVTEGSEDDIKLQPFIAPINHNTLTSAKAMQIVHTLMGNFCHRDKDKISQMEDMGNNACFLMEYHDKVHLNDVCQIIHSLNNSLSHTSFHLKSVTYQKNKSVDMIRLNPQQRPDKAVTRNLFPPEDDYFTQLFT